MPMATEIRSRVASRMNEFTAQASANAMHLGKHYCRTCGSWEDQHGAAVLRCASA